MTIRVLACLSIAAVCALGQGNGGTITGTAKDPVGGPVIGQTVQATNTANGTVYKATTSKQGAYSISGLPPGAYDVSLTVPGIAPFSQKNIAIGPNATARIEINLAEGSQLSTLGEDTLAIGVDAKRHQPPSGPAPKTADGHPDLSGVWWGPRTVDPGKAEWLPAAQQVARKRVEDNRKDSPQARCLPSPVTRLGPLYEFVQSKDFLIEISDDDSPGFHQIYLGGRTHPAEPDPQWYGDSIGRWEGDTLVVDRVNFDEGVWLDAEAHPHSDKLHVIERYRRPDLGHLETEITVEDPGVLARPYTMKRVSDLAQGEYIREFMCTENNQDVPHLVGR